jgi:hypothetical protein
MSEENVEIVKRGDFSSLGVGSTSAPGNPAQREKFNQERGKPHGPHRLHHRHGS